MRRFFHIVVFFLVLLGFAALNPETGYAAVNCPPPGAWLITRADGSKEPFTTSTPLRLQIDVSETSEFGSFQGWSVISNLEDGPGNLGRALIAEGFLLSSPDGRLTGTNIDVTFGPFPSTGTKQLFIVPALIKNPNEAVCSSPTFSINIGLTPNQADFDLCKQTADAKEEGPDFKACVACVEKDAIWTAFGCVNVTSPTNIVQDLLKIGLAMSGGFVLLTILYGSFMLSTSSGNPKRVEEAQQMISSAVMGLFFVIFSVVILQFIGVSILRIPGFGT